jgi:hypothetical protein
MDEGMKIVYGATELVFNETKSQIVDETLKIVDNYKADIAQLNQWLTNEQNRIKNEYEKRQRFIVENAEDALRMHAIGVTK